MRDERNELISEHRRRGERRRTAFNDAAPKVKGKKTKGKREPIKTYERIWK